MPVTPEIGRFVDGFGKAVAAKAIIEVARDHQRACGARGIEHKPFEAFGQDMGQLGATGRVAQFARRLHPRQGLGAILRHAAASPETVRQGKTARPGLAIARFAKPRCRPCQLGLPRGLRRGRSIGHQMAQHHFARNPAGDRIALGALRIDRGNPGCRVPNSRVPNFHGLQRLARRRAKAGIAAVAPVDLIIERVDLLRDPRRFGGCLRIGVGGAQGQNDRQNPQKPNAILRLVVS